MERLDKLADRIKQLEGELDTLRAELVNLRREYTQHWRGEPHYGVRAGR